MKLIGTLTLAKAAVLQRLNRWNIAGICTITTVRRATV